MCLLLEFNCLFEIIVGEIVDASPYQRWLRCCSAAVRNVQLGAGALVDEPLHRAAALIETFDVEAAMAV